MIFLWTLFCRYYSVSLQIGNPPKDFTFDVDTGSDLTWVQCDAPCSGCTVVYTYIIRFISHVKIDLFLFLFLFIFVCFVAY